MPDSPMPGPHEGQEYTPLYGCVSDGVLSLVRWGRLPLQQLACRLVLSGAAISRCHYRCH